MFTRSFIILIKHRRGNTGFYEKEKNLIGNSNKVKRAQVKQTPSIRNVIF
jgi:hypothetical protein